MLEKAREFMRRRKAQLLGAHLAGKQTLVKGPGGVLFPRLRGRHLSTTADRCGGAKGRLIVNRRASSDEEWMPHFVGPWENVVDGDNLVVTQAESLMADAMAGVANSAINYIELGDPSPATTPALADTGLEQTTAQRKAAIVTVASNVLRAEVTFLTSEGNGFTYTEAALFTGPFAAGSMFARKIFNGITKTNSFELQFVWLVTFLVNPTASGGAGVLLTGPSATAPDTVYVATGGEASVAATFDFVVNSNLIEVFINGQRQVPGRQYTEAGAGSLSAPVGGAPGNKGVNLVSFTLNLGDVVYLRLVTLTP